MAASPGAASVPTPGGVVESFDEGTRLRALRRTIEKPREVLEGIGALVVSYSQDAFRLQRLGSKAWKERVNPNFPAVLADLAVGRNPPVQRFEARPALVDTGTMRNTIAARTFGEDWVEVGSNLPYAGVLHEGGDSQTVPITEAIQKRLADFIKRSKNPLAGKLRWLLAPGLRDQRITITHPARPIVGVPDQLAKDVEEIYGVAIRRGD